MECNRRAQTVLTARTASELVAANGSSSAAASMGYHVLRYSLSSNLARAGVDDRIIDHFMGHQTEEMRRRYQHLFPEEKRKALSQLGY